MTMKEELAALKKKLDAGDITAFKFRQGTRQIKKKYGVDAPSNVTKIIRSLTTPSPKSAKGKAMATEAKTKAENASSDRQLIAKAKTASAKKTPSKKRAAPKFNPSGMKMSTKDMEKELSSKFNKSSPPSSKRGSKSSGSKLSKFEQAFADARKAGKKTFKFTNRAGNTTTYTTERRDKKPLPKKGKK